MSVERDVIGTLPDGKPVEKLTITNSGGMKIAAMNYGATLIRVEVPDRYGKMADVVLGFDNLRDYVEHNQFFGSTVGRYANRIACGTFTLDGVDYQLAVNNNGNHLHGGDIGFDKKSWAAQVSHHDNAVRFTYVSPDGEENYPGTLECNVTYSLGEDNDLRITYHAVTDKPTILNLTNHSYFNLAGRGNILNHMLSINAHRFTPTDENQIPTGEIRPVAGTPMDFVNLHRIGDRMDANDEQLLIGGGYDHNWVLNKTIAGELSLAARVEEYDTGRCLECHTTTPGIQLCTSNFLNLDVPGKKGMPLTRYAAFCLETQYFPDSPNKPNFPSAVLRPGDIYKQVTVYKFGTVE
ncbi:MAG TPA: aldose epimerase family protein [Phycisphaerae bacterium]|nr:aldose epimerase family protein [Phycisphaerae bacterium]HPS52509.1 aldose epimerase family protein [Phycisphaerae bacterium]